MFTAKTCPLFAPVCETQSGESCEKNTISVCPSFKCSPLEALSPTRGQCQQWSPECAGMPGISGLPGFCTEIVNPSGTTTLVYSTFEKNKPWAKGQNYDKTVLFLDGNPNEWPPVPTNNTGKNLNQCFPKQPTPPVMFVMPPGMPKSVLMPISTPSGYKPQDDEPPYTRNYLLGVGNAACANDNLAPSQRLKAVQTLGVANEKEMFFACKEAVDQLIKKDYATNGVAVVGVSSGAELAPVLSGALDSKKTTISIAAANLSCLPFPFDPSDWSSYTRVNDCIVPLSDYYLVGLFNVDITGHAGVDGNPFTEKTKIFKKTAQDDINFSDVLNALTPSEDEYAIWSPTINIQPWMQIPIPFLPADVKSYNSFFYTGQLPNGTFQFKPYKAASPLGVLLIRKDKISKVWKQLEQYNQTQNSSIDVAKTLLSEFNGNHSMGFTDELGVTGNIMGTSAKPRIGKLSWQNNAPNKFKGRIDLWTGSDVASAYWASTINPYVRQTYLLAASRVAYLGQSDASMVTEYVPYLDQNHTFPITIPASYVRRAIGNVQMFLLPTVDGLSHYLPQPAPSEAITTRPLPIFAGGSVPSPSPSTPVPSKKHGLLLVILVASGIVLLLIATFILRSKSNVPTQNGQ